MDLKGFLRPSASKIILLMILFAGINYFAISQDSGILDGMILSGIPLGFYPVGSYYCQMVYDCALPLEISWTSLAADIIFWYIVSCIFLSLYNKHKNQKVK
jgi:hypothetical protein